MRWVFHYDVIVTRMLSFLGCWVCGVSSFPLIFLDHFHLLANGEYIAPFFHEYLFLNLRGEITWLEHKCWFYQTVCYLELLLPKSLSASCLPRNHELLNHISERECYGWIHRDWLSPSVMILVCIACDAFTFEILEVVAEYLTLGAHELRFQCHVLSAIILDFPPPLWNC